MALYSSDGFPTNINKNLIGKPAYTYRNNAHNCAPVVSWGEGLSQEDLMNKDECIVVSENDQILGHDSKYNAHRFNQDNPNGILHRAFSVFLFNQEGKLLLQRRASDKITFPSVWTNTCCSHPLYGYSPSEVDDEKSVNKGELLGIKSAAVRKLKHELGIEPSQLSIDAFKYLGRIHYCAADDSVCDEGSDSEGGEDRGGNDVDNSDIGSIDNSSIEYSNMDGAWGEHEIGM